ncbi:MAG: Xaa-Pro peptidase family protein [Syntrophomonadaceae bacterium]|nr:Xaa-Pro peptidase family protein [Syntrophomonadaceae bacterium]MDD3024389.1 Xaa-Pro peptidase family protein [Syntrophomonadaceae bacterium]
MNKERLAKLLLSMENNQIDALLVSKPENIRYLSGFTGGSDARLLISDRENCILSDNRYWEQVTLECPGWQFWEVKPPGYNELRKLSQPYKRMGVESHYITYQFFMDLQSILDVKIVALSGLIEKLRLCKEESELECLRTAGQIGDAVFKDICGFLKAGQSEMQIANQIVFWLKEKGCNKEAFDTIAVSAENAALPHGQPGKRQIKAGDMLTMDFGGFYQGYAGDMTRTVVFNKPDNHFRENYLKVLEAQQLGVSIIKSGVPCREVDQAVRNCLKKYDLDQYFIHSTGHGLGLEIHEQPRISPVSEILLLENMVVTIEPGIYIPGWGGIRIEDSVIVKSEGCELLTHSDKNLIII